MTATTRERQSSFLTARRDGFVYRGAEVLHLPPKEQAALHLLLRRSPAVVDKDEFSEHVWPGSGMSDESLTRCIHRIRQLLRECGDDVHIEALYGRGYRLTQDTAPPATGMAHQRLLAVANAPPHLTEALIFARNLFSQRTPAALTQAAKILRDTIEQAPDYAAARVALAECLAGSNSWGVAIDISLIEEGLHHLDLAEKSMPELPGLHAARACLLDRAWRFREAGDAASEALRENPHDPDTNFHYGWHLLAIGQAEAGCQALRQAVNLHPYSVLLRITLGRALMHANAPEAALRELQAACELAPGNELAELYLTALRAWQQPNAKVVSAARKLAASSTALTLAPSVLSYALARIGRHDESAAVIEACIGSPKANACTNSLHVSALLVLGRIDDAMALIERAFDAHSGILPMMLHDPIHEGLKQHRAYDALYRQVFRDL